MTYSSFLPSLYSSIILTTVRLNLVCCLTCAAPNPFLVSPRVCIAHNLEVRLLYAQHMTNGSAKLLEATYKTVTINSHDPKMANQVGRCDGRIYSLDMMILSLFLLSTLPHTWLRWTPVFICEETAPKWMRIQFRPTDLVFSMTWPRKSSSPFFHTLTREICSLSARWGLDALLQILQTCGF